MALFQAWADRVPVLLIVGMQREPTGVVNLPHSAQDLGVIVRDFVKFDDQTTTLQRFVESAMRGYQLAMTPPRGPVMLVVPTKVARSQPGWDSMIELGELLQCPVDPGGYGSWQDFPTWHPLWGNGGPQYQADVTLGLEMNDMSNLARAARASGRKTISISSEHLFQHSNIHDYGRYADVDLAIGGDAEASLPLLIEEARKLITPEKRRGRLGERGGGE